MMRKQFLLTVAVIATFLTPVVAQVAPANAASTTACPGGTTNTWTGAADTNWTNTANWSGATVPGNGGTAIVCIPAVATSSAHAPFINSTEDIGSLTALDDDLGSTTTSMVSLSGIGHLTLANASRFTGLDLSVDGGHVTMNATGNEIDELLFMNTATIDGSGSFTTTATSQTQLGNSDSGTNTIGATWNVDGSVLWSDGALTSTAPINVTANGVLDAGGLANPETLTASALNVTGGNVQAVGGAAVTVSAPVTLSDGSININGSLASLTQTGGTLGGQSGTATVFHVTGNYVQSGGSLDVYVHGTGTAGTDYSQLVVGGNYTLTNAPTFFFNNDNAYAGTLSDSFSNLVTVTGTLSGTFDANIQAQLSNTAVVPQLSYAAHAIDATIVSAPGTVDGMVYVDTDANGSSAGGESGLDTPAGTVVYDDVNNNSVLDNGEPSQTLTANDEGNYSLTVPGASTAHIRVTPVAGYILVTSLPVNVTVTGGSDTPNTDIGIFQTGSISGTVFTDTDGNGSQNNGEAGIAGVTVYLDANNNGALDGGEVTQTTAGNGSYSFTGLTVTNATRVRAVAPDGLLITTGEPLDHNILSGSAYTGDDFGFNTTGPAEPSGPQFGDAPQDPISQGTGYWTISPNGTITSFGDAPNLGSPASIPNLNAPIVSVTADPSGGGYWALGSDGGVFSYGSSQFFGSTSSLKLNKPVDAMAATPDGQGYWLVAQDGGVFAYGDAGFFGSTGGIKLNQPIVGVVATPDGGGYWLVAKDGGVFAYGDAQFFGSMAGQHLSTPIVGTAATRDGEGYYLASADGGVFAFGDAPFNGSMGGKPLNAPVTSIKTTGDGGGYYLFAKDGGVFAFGTAGFLGSQA